MLDRHYSFKICSPSRCSLQTGRLPVHVNIKNTSPVVHNASDPVSGFQGIPRNMTGIAEKLVGTGYRTAMTGKWDAGMATPRHTPQGRGYQEFYGYFQHANNYVSAELRSCRASAAASLLQPIANVPFQYFLMHVQPPFAHAQWTKGVDLPSTGEVDICLNHFTDLNIQNATYRGGELDPARLDGSCSDSAAADPACYESAIFREQGLRVIRGHDRATMGPLFYLHAFHLVHTPLDVPQAYLAAADERVKPFAFDDAGRRNYSAMVAFMDEVAGELTGALKEKGMWEDTLVVGGGCRCLTQW